MKLHITVSDLPERQWPLDRSFSDTLSTEKALFEEVRALRADGYWSARVLSTAWRGSTLEAQLERGQPIQWASVDWSDERFELLPTDPKLQRWSGKRWSGTDWIRWESRVLDLAENNGYPFARIDWQELAVSADSVSGVLAFEPGPYIRYDSVNVRGYDELTESMTANLLGLKAGAPYSEKTLSDLGQTVADIEYLSMPRSPQVLFNREKTVVFAYLEKEKANQFDGILGFNANDQGVTVTGNVYLRLLNAFNRGEEVIVDWSSPGNTTQKLDLKASYPYLFGWNWALEGGLNLLKQDSSFLNSSSNLGIRYFISPRSSVNFSFSSKSSSLLGDEAVAGVVDYSSSFYSVGLRLRTTDRRVAPKNGVRVDAQFGLGERRADDSRTTQLRTTVDAGSYWNFSSLLVLHNRIQFGRFDGQLQNAGLGPSYYNELFRFGGIQNLRGFDEQSLFIAQYLIGTVELRLLTGRDGFIFAFSDFGFLDPGQLFEINLPEGGSTWSFGAGAAFQTPAGLLNLTYALGRRSGSDFQLDQAKVHIGLINQF